MNKQQFWDIAGNYLIKNSEQSEWQNMREDRRRVKLRVYGEKDPDANPYYSRNHILHRCIMAVEKIISLSGPCKFDDKVLNILDQLYTSEYNEKADPAQMADKLMQNELPLVRDFVYFISHNIITIDRIAGGHRGKIKNDTEIDISILLMPEGKEEELLKDVANICSEFEVKCLQLFD